MSNVYAYLLQITDEFRENYELITKKADELLDRMSVLETRIQELEIRINPNREDS